MGKCKKTKVLIYRLFSFYKNSLKLQIWVEPIIKLLVKPKQVTMIYNLRMKLLPINDRATFQL